MIFCTLFIAKILSRNIAILINTSKDYNNYRHTSNILLFSHTLRKENKNYDTILTLTSDNILRNDRNILKDYFYIDKHTKLKVKQKLTPLSSITILNILSGYHESLRTVDIDTNILIYICGHGGDGFIKILDREYLLRYDLTKSLITLSRKVHKMLVIVDTCQAESVVDYKLLLKNTAIVFTSKKGEPSVSNVINNRLGFNVIDGFMNIFNDIYGEKLDLYMENFIELFIHADVGSTVQFFGAKNYFKLKDFFCSEDIIDESKVEL